MYQQYVSFGEKIVKIGPADHEIIWLKFKKKIDEGMTTNLTATGIHVPHGTTQR